MVKAYKWNFDKEGYDPVELPEGSHIYIDDLEEQIECASCGTKIIAGDSYNSMTIHNHIGFGFMVCPECYDIERALRKFYREKYWKQKGD